MKKNYDLCEFETLSASTQKKVAKTMSVDNRICLIGECKERYNHCMNDKVIHYNLINRYANIYTILLESAA